MGQGNVRTKLESHDAQLGNIVMYDVTQNSLYDINHVDLAINNILSLMVQGDKLLLPHGNYNFTNTINVTSPHGLTDCNVIFDGILNQVGTFTAMIITADYCKVKVNNMRSNLVPNATFSNILSDGIVIAEGYHTNLDIGQLSGFLTGVKVAPNNSLGVQYCKTVWNEIYNCTTPILLHCGDTGISWVNENTFTGGRIDGYNGIQFIKGLQQTDPYNNNKFYNVGFEGITLTALVLTFCTNNLFVGFRMSESIGANYITEDSTCSYNKFINSCSIFKSKVISTAKESTYDLPMFSDDSQMISSHFVTSPYNLTNDFQFEIMERSTGFMNNGFTFGQNGSSNLWNTFLGYVFINGVRTPVCPIYEQGTCVLTNANLTMKYLYKYLLITSSTTVVTITIPIMYMYDGATFTFGTTSNANNIVFVGADASTQFTITSASGVGTFSAIWNNATYSFVPYKTCATTPAI